MKCEICGSDYAENYYKDKYTEEIICEDCLLGIDGITTSTTTHYSLEGIYLGSDDDSQEVVDNICDYTSFEKIEEE